MNRAEWSGSLPGGPKSTGEGSEIRESWVHILEAERRVVHSCLQVGQVDKAKKQSSHIGERIGSGGACGKPENGCSG